MDAAVPPDSDDDSAVATLDRIIHTLDGIAEMILELKYAQCAPGYFSSIARRLVVIEFWQLADLLDDAVDGERLMEEERSTILPADLVLTGRRHDTGEDVYLLVEISGRIDVHDVERAVERAAVLQKLGRPVLPVVAGHWINDEAAELAHALGVWYAQGGRVTAPRPA